MKSLLFAAAALALVSSSAIAAGPDQIIGQKIILPIVPPDLRKELDDAIAVARAKAAIKFYDQIERDLDAIDTSKICTDAWTNCTPDRYETCYTATVKHGCIERVEAAKAEHRRTGRVPPQSKN